MTHILVVEDHPSLQNLYQTLLHQAGYQVEVADNGNAALELAHRHPPDLILLDLLLPHVGGLEFLRNYDLSQHPDTAVIVLSNLGSPELAQEARALGAGLYLAKATLSPQGLLEVIRQALNEHSHHHRRRPPQPAA